MINEIPFPSGEAISASVPLRSNSAVGTSNYCYNTCFVPNLSFNLMGFILFNVPSLFLTLTKNKVGDILSKSTFWLVFIFANVKEISESIADVNHFYPFNLYIFLSTFSAIV